MRTIVVQIKCSIIEKSYRPSRVSTCFAFLPCKRLFKRVDEALNSSWLIGVSKSNLCCFTVPSSNTSTRCAERSVTDKPQIGLIVLHQRAERSVLPRYGANAPLQKLSIVPIDLVDPAPGRTGGE